MLWKNGDYSSYNGSQFRTMQDEAMEFLELYSNHQRLKKVQRVFAKVWICLAGVITAFLNKNKNHSDTVINEVQRLFTVLPKKLALKVAGLSSHAFHYRLSKLKQACTDSPFALCLKRHPMQLSFKELSIMKSILADQQFACWPVSSIAHYARRNGLLFASLSTWYKYLPFIGYKKKLTKVIEVCNGMVTSAPNQFLHVDTTFWKLDPQTEAAIVLVTDNFSKAILGWNVSLKKDAGNVITALSKAIQTIQLHHPDHISSTLIADGGKENHAVSVTELLHQTLHPSITKIIALKDISFSNSPIEAINKIMKVYLRFHNPTTIPKVIECISTAVNDYSSVRPHGSLNGLIPMEAYTQIYPQTDFSTFSHDARNQRITNNRRHCCKIC